MPVLKFKYVEIDSRNLNVTLFRQLPIISLCDEEGDQDPSLELIGTVLYKQKSVEYWVLATQADRVVRCALDLQLESLANLNSSLKTWTGYSLSPSSQREGIDSVEHRQVAMYTKKIITEPKRFAAHTNAAKLEQIFL